MASDIPPRMTISQIYEESGMMYIRYDGKIEQRENRPAFNKTQEQVAYKHRSGKCFSLLMGREFKPDQYTILIDFDNKVEGYAKSGLDIVDELKMDRYFAPKQHTPSGGLHYIFYVDGEQAKRIVSKTCITHNESSTIWLLNLRLGCAIANQVI